MMENVCFFRVYLVPPLDIHSVTMLPLGHETDKLLVPSRRTNDPIYFLKAQNLYFPKMVGGYVTKVAY